MSEVKDYEVSFSLEINVEEALTEIRKVQTLLYRTLGLLRRFGLPEDISEGVAFVQRLIAALNALRLSLIALQAAAGPVGWALAIVGIVGTAVTFADTIESGMQTR